MMRKLFPLLLLLLCAPAWAQVGGGIYNPGTGSGGGGGGVTSLNTLTGALSLTSTGSTITITPSGSTINLEAASSAPTFNLIGSGTNTTAAMIVGTGASLSVSGSGTIAATSVPVAGIIGSSVPAWTITGNGAASASPFNLTGTPFAGTGTTSTPLQYFNNAVTQPTTWNTAGTYEGINAASGFAGNFIDYHINGGSSLFKIDSAGILTTAGVGHFNAGIGTTFVQSSAGYQLTFSPSVSQSGILMTGTTNSSGTGTTTFPYVFYQPVGTSAVTTWATAGTIYGANTPSGFAGNFIDFHVNGGASLFSISNTGAITSNTLTTGGILKSSTGGLISNATAGTDYQAPISLTTTGTSGAATFTGNVLNIPNYASGGGSGTVTSVATDATLTGGPITTTGTLGLNLANSNTFSAVQGISANGAASTAGFLLSGAPITSGGSGTTTVPYLFLQPSGASAVTSWATAGTYIGINAASGFTGNFLEGHINGAAPVWNITAIGGINGNTFGSSLASTASKAVYTATGTLFTGGSGTTTFPQWFAQTGAATAASTWSTAGTYFGVNANSGFTGNFIDFRINGATPVFTVGSNSLTTSLAMAFSNRVVSSSPGSASNAAYSTTGALFTGGSGTTNVPQWFSQPSAASAVTTWSTSGTVFGANEASGFAGNFEDYHVNGGTSLWSISSTGAVASAAGGVFGANLSSPQVYSTVQALTPGTTVAWNAALGANATLSPVQSFTLSNPTNIVAGGNYMITITQDAAGSRVITYGTAYKFPGGTKFILSTAANAVDTLSCYSPDATNMECVGQAAFQ